MLLLIHNLPPNIDYTRIQNLIISKCGVSSVILDNLVREGAGSKVTVGLIDEADAAIVKRNLNGFFMGEYQLFVEEIRNKSTYKQSYESSNARPQNWSAATNRWPSNNDISYKAASSSSTPILRSRFQDQMYGHSPTYDDINSSFNQVTNFSSPAHGLDTSINQFGQNLVLQQKSRYKLTNYPTNRNFNNSSTSNVSQRSDRSLHYNTVAPKVSNPREYSLQNERHPIENKNSQSVSGISKRRASPSGSQIQKSKYPHKDPPAFFSSSQNEFRKSFPARSHENSYNQGSFSNTSSDVAIKEFPNTTQKQPSALMAGLNKFGHNSTNNESSYDKSQFLAPNTSQPIASGKFGVSKQNSNSDTVFTPNNTNKSFNSPLNSNFGQTRNVKFQKNEHARLKNLFKKDETYRSTAAARLVRQINFDDFLNIWPPSEPRELDTVRFRNIFARKLRLEVIRRINRMLSGQIGVPIDIIMARYKQKYDLNDHNDVMQKISTRANKKFAKEYKTTMKRISEGKSVSKYKKQKRPPKKKAQSEPTIPCVYPKRPEWWVNMKKAAFHMENQSKLVKVNMHKKIFLSIKTALFAEMDFHAKTGYEMDENVQTDTLTPHLQSYRVADENLLAITPVEGVNLPEIRPLNDFLKPHNIIGLKKFTTRNMCLALFKSKGDCEKLYAMKKTTVGGKMVTFLPIAKAADLCENPIQHTGIVCKTETIDVDNNTDGEKEIKSEHPAEHVNTTETSKKHTIADGNAIEIKTEIVDSAESMNDDSTTQNVTEQQVQSTESIKKEPGAVTGSSELVNNPENIEKCPKSASEISEIASNIENSSTLKSNNKPSVDVETVDITDTVPDGLLSDDDMEVNMDELEDY